MGNFKRLKDPIYGYINIPTNYMNDIIDTAEFQRLRRIIQTSYAPLYSSAVHNRFIHSIGVYHLGTIACKQLKKEISQLDDIDINELNSICEVFELACLLHDVGHAPFSHTGESFYLSDQSDYSELHNYLKTAVNVDAFSNDVPRDSSASAAPHEIMSAIIGINTYTVFFNNDERKEFFARCITGYKYSIKNSSNDIKNCFIEMLNSKIIDVDKLDYLIRDAYITGFNTVSIDFERLLNSLTIIEENGRYKLSYYKNAISVIENVVYAHDSERKWIQTHPVVLYEIYLLQGMISYLNSKINLESHGLFSVRSLSKEGIDLKSLHISLMCDDDIIFMSKNIYPCKLSNEFFERKLRRHPLWKSEAEYKAFMLDISSGGKVLESLEKALDDTVKYLIKSTDLWVINDELIDKLSSEITKIQNDTILDKETKHVQLSGKENILKIMRCLKSYADDKKMECDFVILKASQFNSGFGKSDFSDINIAFKTQTGIKIQKFGKIVSSLQARERARDNFFYLFYKRNSGDSEMNINPEEICKKLFSVMID